ncbi:HK97-gp10 family putative phage morphogenesis protein [Campylobacter fetus]|nr:HK97-gp10 family putative phage morphogenesis protein [Campylobacter fetus]CDF65223.1 hypothetical protein CSG_13120 [Campylobacter fetus subsp. venerealis str. 84-112]
MNKIFKNFMFKVGAEVVNDSKAIAPFKTGNLKKDIQVFKADQTSVTIGNSKLAPYAKFVHFGTKPHIIRVKKAKALANKKAGLCFGKQVNHPGTKAQPYLEDGLNNYISSSGLARAKEDLAKDVRNKVLNDIKKALKL